MSGAAYMAIGHVSRSQQDAGSGKTAAGGASYMLRLGAHRNAEDQVLAEGEGNLPHWAKDARAYFEAEDRFTTRKNARLANTVELALPRDVLSLEEQQQLVEAFVEAVLEEERVPYVWAIHEGKGDNPHVHLQFSNTVNDGCEARPMHRWFRRNNPKDPEKGGAPSTRRFQRAYSKVELRKLWEKCANEAMADAGVEVRLDMSSYKRRGIELLPQLKQGRPTEALGEGDERRLWPHLAAAVNEERRRENARLILERPERLLDLYAHQRCITQPQLEHELRSRFSHDPEAARQVRAQLDARLIDVGTDRRGNRMRATRAQLCAHPELAVRALTQTRSTFNESDLADLFGDDEAGTKALIAVRAHPDLVSVGAHPAGHPAPGGEQAYEERFTSAELLEAERRLHQHVNALASERGVCLELAHVERAANRRTLTGEQREMLAALAGADERPRALTLVQGKPGTGKSYVVGALREAAEAQGVRVIGAAIAGVAAQSLGEDAGIESYTVAKLTNVLRRRELDLENAILVIDEAGMADIRALEELVVRARDAGVSRIAMIGDTAQLSPVGPGRPFEQLQAAYGAVELTGIQRQKVDWQREASVRMATGAAEDIAQGVGAYRERGFVQEHATRAAGLEAVAREWMEDVAAHPDGSRLMMAYLNEDVDRLNALARTALRDAGLLGDDHTFRDKTGIEHHFAVGDQVIFVAGAAELNAPTGTAAEVLDIRDGRLHLAFKCRTTTVDSQVLGARAEGLKQGARFKLRRDVDGVGKAGERVEVVEILEDRVRLRVYDRKVGVSGRVIAPYLKHGFARTTHRSQGATVDRTWLYADPNLQAEAAFVALTRHRHSTRLHYDREAFAPSEFPGGELLHEATAYDRLLSALGRRAPELTATEAFERGDRDRVTDASVYERRYRMAKDEVRRQALIRQLRSIASSELTGAAAVASHPAVRLAQTEHQQAHRRAVRANQHLRHVLRRAPRSSRFGANVRFHKQLADAAAQARAAERDEKHALDALKIVAHHRDVQEHARAALCRHRRQVHEAKQALGRLEAIDARKRASSYARDYVERYNRAAGCEAMRLATRDDQGPEQHYRFVGAVDHGERTLAVLEHPAGGRLCLDATGDRTLARLQAGEHVGLNGRWLQKRNLQWYQQQVRLALQAHGLDPAATPHAIASEAKWEVSAMERRADGLHIAILKDEAGRSAWFDLRLTHERHRVQVGDQIAIERPPQAEPENARASESSSTKELDQGRATELVPPPQREPSREQKAVPRVRITRPAAATEEGLRALTARLEHLRSERERLGEPPKELSAHELYAQHPEVRSASTRVRAADEQVLAARRAEAALKARARPASPGELAEARERTEQAEQRAHTLRERLKKGITKEVKMDVERAVADANEARVHHVQRAKKLDQEIRVVERETAAREVALELVKQGLRARLADDTDAPRAFVVRGVREVLGGRHKVALLDAADGSVVVAPVTGHRNADRLREGDLVTFNGPERRYLQNPYRQQELQAKQKLAELQPLTKERSPDVYDALRDHARLGPEAKKLAQLADRLQEIVHQDGGASYRMREQLRQGRQRLWARVRAEGPALERATAQALAELKGQREAAFKAQRAAKMQLHRAKERAASIRLRHELNQGRPEGARVRMMPKDQRVYELQQLIERGRRTYLLARSQDGAQYLVNATRVPALREGAERGLLFTYGRDGLAPLPQHQERLEASRERARAMRGRVR